MQVDVYILAPHRTSFGISSLLVIVTVRFWSDWPVVGIAEANEMKATKAMLKIWLFMVIVLISLILNFVIDQKEALHYMIQGVVGNSDKELDDVKQSKER